MWSTTRSLRLIRGRGGLAQPSRMPSLRNRCLAAATVTSPRRYASRCPVLSKMYCCFGASLLNDLTRRATRPLPCEACRFFRPTGSGFLDGWNMCRIKDSSDSVSLAATRCPSSCCVIARCALSYTPALGERVNLTPDILRMCLARHARTVGLSG